MAAVLMRAGVLLLLGIAGCFAKPDRPVVSDAGPDAPPTVVAARITSGATHACLVVEDGTLACWGNNEYGQLGNRPEPEVALPVPASTDKGWSAVAAGYRHTCAVRDAAVYCWGGNDAAQTFPNQVTEPRPMDKVQLPDDKAVHNVFVGETVSCAIATDDTAYCWGLKNFANVGDTLPEQVVARDAEGTVVEDRFRHFAIAKRHACAIGDTTGRVYCWGHNEAWQLGHDSTSTPATTFGEIRRIASDAAFDSIAATEYTTCAIMTATRDLYCWGSTQDGHFGGAAAEPNVRLALVDNMREWNQVAIGRTHLCGLEASGVSCIGFDGFGAVGNGKFTGAIVFGAPSLTDVVAIAAMEQASCALARDGRAWCWGSNRYGELGSGVVASKRFPVRVALGEAAEQLALGEHHTCVRTADKRVSCWGDNSTLQIDGQKLGIQERVPWQHPSLVDVQQIVAGARHTCALSPSLLTCWGANESAQLGTQAGPPGTSASSGSELTALAAASDTTCGIEPPGLLSCWGNVPGVGQSRPPSFVSADTNWLTVGVGGTPEDGFVVATKGTSASFSVVGFGDNCALGGVAFSDSTPADPLVLLPDESIDAPLPEIAAAPGGRHVCIHHAIDTNIVIGCWGDNVFGQINETHPDCAMNTAQGGAAATAPPSNWGAVDATLDTVTTAATHSCALDNAGRAYCWGMNDHFALGALSDTGGVPVELFPGRLWSQIVTAPTHTCGIEKATRDVYCWGENIFGAVGDGTSFEPTPQRVGSLQP